MPTIPLPDDPHLGQLRRQARELRQAVLAGDARAVATVSELRPGGATDPFPLTAAQLVIARRYGFASWPRLKHHVELVNSLTRRPERVESSADVGDEFLRLACLTYGGDDVQRRRQAAALLAEHPEIAGANIHTAAATTDVEAVRRLLRADPRSAQTDGGPYDWVPLMYLAYARHDAAIREDDVLATARALLAAGADPNAGYLWHGMPSPFTILTGVFGEGEQGPRDQPRHPHSLPLARLLLEAGADPNDSQTLYNRMFEAGNDHLELLFEFGLGRGDGGPWRARLGDAAMSPTDLIEYQLRWAVRHDMVERVRLLIANGADPARPIDGHHNAVDVAALLGNTSVVELLEASGCPPPTLDAVERLLGCLAAGDRAGTQQLLATDPALLDAARTARPSLLVDAVAANRRGAMELLVDLGFDVNAYGRGDTPQNGVWETPLHIAAGDGRVELAEYLLAHGADPTIHDRRFDATPLGWAIHFEHLAMIDLLTPLTPD
jgi:ankyrin repeat protein